MYFCVFFFCDFKVYCVLCIILVLKEFDIILIILNIGVVVFNFFYFEKWLIFCFNVN